MQLCIQYLACRLSIDFWLTRYVLQFGYHNPKELISLNKNQPHVFMMINLTPTQNLEDYSFKNTYNIF